MRALPLFALLMASGCAAEPAQKAQCPAFADVAPPMIGADYLEDLSHRLAGPDRANTVVTAVADIRTRAPNLSADEVTDILIAADCPNAAAKPMHDLAAERANIAAFRAQVLTLMAPTPTH